MTEPVFFEPVRRISAAEIAILTGSSLHNPAHANVQVSGIAALTDPRPESLVFADGKRKAADVASLRAAAIICTAELAPAVPPNVAVLIARQPQRAFAQVGRTLFPDADLPVAVAGGEGISPHAIIDPTANLEPGAIVEHGAVIGAAVSIGAGTIVGPNAVIGKGCQIGRNGYVGPNSSIQYALIGNGVIIHGGARIGQDGFGYVSGPRGPEKIPQLGRVVIQDNVEIGANTTIDRGALDDTVIGEGTKIDNLVQIGHNSRIGRGCVIAGQSGLSGSVTIGDFSMIGGGVGIADHVTIGAGVQLAGGSGVIGDIPAGSRWAGYPAQPVRAHFREIATLRALAAAKNTKGKPDV